MKLFLVEQISNGTQDRLDPWYVTGLLEGEGSFTFSRSGRGVTLYFAVRTRAGARPLLERVRRFFGGAGRIYETGGGALYFRVTRRHELDRITAHFDAYPLQGPHATAYAVWRRMLHVKHSPGARRAFGELEALAAELRKRAPKRRGMGQDLPT